MTPGRRIGRLENVAAKALGYSVYLGLGTAKIRGLRLILQEYA